MPDLQEVFRMATQKVGPEPGALERQHRFQRRTTTRRKVAAFAVAAAIGVAAVALTLVNWPSGNTSTPADQVPIDQPSPALVAGNESPLGIVTFDGKTCSMEVTADRIEPGMVVFEAINASDQRAMFDVFQLLEGYTFQAFEATVEGWPPDVEAGTPGQGWPGKTKVTYLGSEAMPANSSGTIARTMAGGRYAIICLQPVEGATGGARLRSSGIVGPIEVR